MSTLLNFSTIGILKQAMVQTYPNLEVPILAGFNIHMDKWVIDKIKPTTGAITTTLQMDIQLQDIHHLTNNWGTDPIQIWPTNNTSQEQMHRGTFKPFYLNCFGVSKHVGVSDQQVG